MIARHINKPIPVEPEKDGKEWPGFCKRVPLGSGDVAIAPDLSVWVRSLLDNERTK